VSPILAYTCMCSSLSVSDSISIAPLTVQSSSFDSASCINRFDCNCIKGILFLTGGQAVNFRGQARLLSVLLKHFGLPLKRKCF